MSVGIDHSSTIYVSKGSRSGILAFFEGHFHLLVLEDSLYHVRTEKEQGDACSNQYELNFTAGMFLHSLQHCPSVKELKEKLFVWYPAVAQVQLSNECETFLRTLEKHRLIELLENHECAQPAIEVAASVTEDLFKGKPAYENFSASPINWGATAFVNTASNPPSDTDNPYSHGCACC